MNGIVSSRLDGFSHISYRDQILDSQPSTFVITFRRVRVFYVTAPARWRFALTMQLPAVCSVHLLDLAVMTQTCDRFALKGHYYATVETSDRGAIHLQSLLSSCGPGRSGVRDPALGGNCKGFAMPQRLQ